MNNYIMETEMAKEAQLEKTKGAGGPCCAGRRVALKLALKNK